MELYCKLGRRYLPASSDQVLATARALATLQVNEAGSVLTSPRAASDFLRQRFLGLEHEVFGILYLDSRNRVICFEEMFRGTIDGASVHPREVVKGALKANAAAVVLAHNHPSGVAEPSQADQIITTRLRDALALVEIRLLDHLIVGGETVTSLAERGCI